MTFYSYEDFCEEVKENFISNMSNQFQNDGYVAQIKKEKVNGKKEEDLFYVAQEDNEEVGIPRITLSSAYNMFRSGTYEIQEYIRNLAETYEKNYTINITKNDEIESELENNIEKAISNVRDFSSKKYMDIDKNSVEDKVFLTLINREWNKETIENIPHINKGEYTIICQLSSDNDLEDNKCKIVTNEMMNEWSINKSELFRLANINSEKLFATTCKPLSDYLTIENSDQLIPDGIVIPDVFVLSNDTNFYGAVTMFYEENPIKKLADELNTNLIIIPTSVHEVFCIADKDINNLELCSKVIQEMNRKMLETDSKSDELLSDNAMYYDKDLDQLIQYDGQNISLSINEQKRKNERRR